MGAPIFPLSQFRNAMEAVAEDPQIDILIVDQSPYTFYMGLSPSTLIKITARVKEKYGKPVLAVLHQIPTESMSGGAGEWSKAKNRYLASDIPVFLTLDRAAKALSNLIKYRYSSNR
jgi:acyl-CoA synthetase (NDP forming)